MNNAMTLFSRESLERAVSMPALPAFAQNPEIQSSLDDLFAKIDASGCYPGISFWTEFMIRETALETAANKYDGFLSILSDVFRTNLPDPAKTLIVNNAVFYYESLLRRNDLLQRYLQVMVDGGERFFTVDRDKEPKKYRTPQDPTGVLKWLVDVEIYRGGEEAGDEGESFYGSPLKSLIEPTLELFPQNDKEEIIKRICKGASKWLMTALARHSSLTEGSGMQDEVSVMLYKVAQKLYPFDHERFYSLGENAATLLTREEASHASLASYYQDERDLGLPSPSKINPIKNMPSPEILNRIGFHVSHLSVRFVGASSIKAYLDNTFGDIKKVAEERNRILRTN